MQIFYYLFRIKMEGCTLKISVCKKKSKRRRIKTALLRENGDYSGWTVFTGKNGTEKSYLITDINSSFEKPEDNDNRGLRKPVASGADVAPRNAALLMQSEAHRCKKCPRSRFFEVPNITLEGAYRYTHRKKSIYFNLLHPYQGHEEGCCDSQKSRYFAE